MTLDTHHPRGDPSRSCENITYKNGSNPMLDAVACSDYLISEFVNKIMQSQYGNKTIVVVVSDTLAMENAVSEILNKEERRNLFMIIESDMNKSVEVRKLGSTLDIAPTVLPFIGYKGEVGLGRSLINKEQSELEIEHIHGNLSYWKPIISSFWNFPKIREFVEINIENRTMNMDGRIFKIPVLVEFNDELETTLRFYWGLEPKYLADYVSKLNNNTYFLLVDKCKKVNKLNESLGKNGFCLIAGRVGENYQSMRLSENIVLDVGDIKELVSIFYLTVRRS